MPISNLVINTRDLAGSLNFYTTHLDTKPVGEPREGRAVLDLVTATVELRATADGQSSWVPDDLQKGFRHIGFKVDELDNRADALKAADVPFHLDPLDAEGGVRICFFFDPNGTLLEFVQGDLQYHTILDPDGVAAERAQGVPGRPRFDHVALTVDDRATTHAFYRDRFGFRFLGTLEQPQDPRGFRIGYLWSEATVIELFTYEAATRDRAPQLDAPGFAYAQLTSGGIRGLTSVTTDGDDAVYVDPDGFPFSISRDAAGAAR
jgi:catechol 2,3-dioxygenase-like lactoylglutathione lyase family enzyme